MNDWLSTFWRYREVRWGTVNEARPRLNPEMDH